MADRAAEIKRIVATLAETGQKLGKVVGAHTVSDSLRGVLGLAPDAPLPDTINVPPGGYERFLTRLKAALGAPEGSTTTQIEELIRTKMRELTAASETTGTAATRITELNARIAALRAELAEVKRGRKSNIDTIAAAAGLPPSANPFGQTVEDVASAITELRRAPPAGGSTPGGGASAAGATPLGGLSGTSGGATPASPMAAAARSRIAASGASPASAAGSPLVATPGGDAHGRIDTRLPSIPEEPASNIAGAAPTVEMPSSRSTPFYTRPEGRIGVGGIPAPVAGSPLGAGININENLRELIKAARVDLDALQKAATSATVTLDYITRIRELPGVPSTASAPINEHLGKVTAVTPTAIKGRDELQAAIAAGVASLGTEDAKKISAIREITRIMNSYRGTPGTVKSVTEAAVSVIRPIELGVTGTRRRDKPAEETTPTGSAASAGAASVPPTLTRGTIVPPDIIRTLTPQFVDLPKDATYQQLIDTLKAKTGETLAEPGPIMRLLKIEGSATTIPQVGEALEKAIPKTAGGARHRRTAHRPRRQKKQTRRVRFSRA